MPGKESQLSIKDRLVPKIKSAYKLIRDWISEFHDLVTRRKPASIAYRFLVRQIDAQLAGSEGTRCLVFSSVEPLNVSSDVALMIGYFLHDELGSRVLLVDGSFTNGGVGDRLGHATEPGFAECVYESGELLNDYIKPTNNPGVFVLPAGTVSRQGKRPAKAQSVLSLLGELNRFDYILIQQGSVTLDTRYLDYAQLADLILMYVEENSTLVSEYKACQKIFQDYHITNTRLIMSETGE